MDDNKEEKILGGRNKKEKRITLAFVKKQMTNEKKVVDDKGES